MLDRKIYTARLAPYRSMSMRNFRIFLCGFFIIQFAFAAPFLVMGAWPVAGFMGLDLLALCIAFYCSYRSAKILEIIDLTMLELVLTKIDIGGKCRVWRFNPCWVRLELIRHPEFGMQNVKLCSKGKQIEIGSFLGPEQKDELVVDLRNALSQARSGPRFDEIS